MHVSALRGLELQLISTLLFRATYLLYFLVPFLIFSCSLMNVWLIFSHLRHTDLVSPFYSALVFLLLFFSQQLNPYCVLWAFYEIFPVRWYINWTANTTRHKERRNSRRLYGTKVSGYNMLLAQLSPMPSDFAVTSEMRHFILPCLSLLLLDHSFSIPLFSSFLFRYWSPSYPPLLSSSLCHAQSLFMASSDGRDNLIDTASITKEKKREREKGGRTVTKTIKARLYGYFAAWVYPLEEALGTQGFYEWQRIVLQD